MQKKSGFLTFCFSFIPGAGQMYLGYMKRGLSLMLVFWGIIFISAFLSLGLICIFLPLIWAYAFFDTFNLRAQTPEQVRMNPDSFLMDMDRLAGTNWRGVVERRHSLFGGLLVFVGLYVLYSTFLRPLLWDLYNRFNLIWLGNIMDGIPTLVVAVLIILLGVYLLKGPAPKRNLPQDDYVAFKGDTTDER